MGIPVVKSIYEHLPVYDSETWESQDLLVGSVRRPKKTKTTKCTTCVCAICCALSICTLSCPHETKHFGSESSTPVKVADVEDVYKRQNLTVPQYRQWRQRVAEEHFVAHGYTGRMCAPKAGSYSQTVAAAVRTSELSDAQAALAAIAKEKKFLDVKVKIRCPNGEVVNSIARLDTGANTDVVSPNLAVVLKANKVPWSERGGAYVEVCGAGSVRPEGYLCVPLTVSARQLGLFRQLHVDIDACIMSLPQGGGSDEPGILIGLPSLLESGLLTSVLTGESNLQRAADSDLDADPIEQWETMGRDEIGDTVQSVNQGTAFTMPKVDGSDAEKAAIWLVLSKYKQVFGPPPLGGSKLRPMSIELKPGAAIPKPAPARRVSPEILQEIREDTELRIAQGWMRKTVVGDRCRFTSPVVAARQPGKTRRRVCGDYRTINDITLLHQYPVKDAREVTAQFKGAKYFGKADMYKGYHQLKLDEEAQELLAIRTPDALYYPLTLPFGPASGPAQFQQRVSEILGDLEGHGVASYIDDLGLYASTFDQDLLRLETMLQRLDSVDVRLNGAKCEFGQKSMEFLGHRVSEAGIAHTPARIDAIKQMSVPTTRTQLRSFLGMCNYFRDSVAKLGPITKVLSSLAGPKGKGAFRSGEWSPLHQEALDNAKSEIAGARLLSYLDYERPILLRTDACDDGAGAMLYQRADGKDCPVAFMSHTFSAAERKWSTYEQECNAIVRAITHFDAMLLGHPFTVETDHRNLCWMQKSDNPKVVRWRTRLSEYSFSVKHIAGTDNPVADALSRLHPIPTVASSLPRVVQALSKSGSIVERPASLSDSLVKTIQHVHAEGGHRRAEAVLDNCGYCQKVAARDQSDGRSVPSFREVMEVGEEWSLDTIGPLEPDEDGNCFIMVAVDGFSRYVMLEPAKDNSGDSAAHFLLKIAGMFGRPRGIRTDGGSQYDNHLIDVLCELLGMQRHVTLAYRPEANGRVERVCKEVGRHLRFICLDRRIEGQWSVMLPIVQRVLNTTPHIALGVEPAKIVFGGFQTMDRYIIPDAITGKVQQGMAAIHSKERKKVVQDYVEHLVDTQASIIKCAQEYQHKYVRSRAERHNKTPPLDAYKPDDWVLATWQGLSLGRSRPKKLGPCWRGPFQVVSVDNIRQTVTLRDPTDLLVMKPDVHVSQLRKYRMGLTGATDLLDLRAMDTAEDVIVKFIDHDMHYPAGKGGKASRKLLPRSEWRFEAQFTDGSTKWMLWPEANRMAALDEYAAQCKLKLPAG